MSCIYCVVNKLLLFVCFSQPPGADYYRYSKKGPRPGVARHTRKIFPPKDYTCEASFFMVISVLIIDNAESNVIIWLRSFFMHVVVKIILIGKYYRIVYTTTCIRLDKLFQSFMLQSWLIGTSFVSWLVVTSSVSIFTSIPTVLSCATSSSTPSGRRRATRWSVISAWWCRRKGRKVSATPPSRHWLS